jgi:hypothetical protein
MPQKVTCPVNPAMWLCPNCTEAARAECASGGGQLKKCEACKNNTCDQCPCGKTCGANAGRHAPTPQAGMEPPVTRQELKHMAFRVATLQSAMVKALLATRAQGTPSTQLMVIVQALGQLATTLLAAADALATFESTQATVFDGSPGV